MSIGSKCILQKGTSNSHPVRTGFKLESKIAELKTDIANEKLKDSKNNNQIELGDNEKKLKDLNKTIEFKEKARKLYDDKDDPLIKDIMIKNAYIRGKDEVKIVNSIKDYLIQEDNKKNRPEMEETPASMTAKKREEEKKEQEEEKEKEHNLEIEASERKHKHDMEKLKLELKLAQEKNAKSNVTRQSMGGKKINTRNKKKISNKTTRKSV